jgi:hypothetical protein
MFENTEGAIKMDNPENWQLRVHKTKKNKTKHNIWHHNTQVCCQFLWIVHSWLPHRYSVTFIYLHNRQSVSFFYTLYIESVELIDWLIDWFLVFNATFSNISATSWRPVELIQRSCNKWMEFICQQRLLYSVNGPVCRFLIPPLTRYQLNHT